MILKIGDKVTYYNHPFAHEKGIVKSLHPTRNDVVFVVYNCAGNWENYKNYTAASTPVENLVLGWIDD